jgi:SAM-dependent methyltransferase
VDVLDVGSAFAEEPYISALAQLGIPRLVGVDAAPAQLPLPFELVSADVRQLPFADRSFELIFCISTLEHIGYDNTVYGLDDERDPDGMRRTLAELRRVLSPGGRLLVTVPCGEQKDYGWFLQETPNGWRQLFETSCWVRTQQVYELRTQGWRLARRFRPDGVLCYTRGPGASAVLCAELGR